MQQPHSLIRQAYNDTKVDKAEGFALAALSSLYGLTQPGGFTESTWRGALRAAALASRGVRGTSSAFFEALLTDRKEEAVVSINPAAPTTLTYVSGLPASFTRHHICRLLKITSSLGTHVVWSDGPDFAASPGGSSNTLFISDTRTALWQASPFAALPGTEQVTAVILPYLPISMTPGPLFSGGVPSGTSGGRACYALMLIKQAGLVPPNYLQPSGGGARPAGQPFGGHLQPDASYKTNSVPANAPGPDPGLPHGFYLADDGQLELSALYNELTITGVQAVVRTTDFGFRVPGIWE